MTEKKATLLGATGLIGNELLQLLVNDTYFTTIQVVVRKPILIEHSKVNVTCIDFTNEEEFNKVLQGSDTVFCCIGTTQKKVRGNKSEYRKVDYDIPTRAAFYSKKYECKHFSLISSIGANHTSKNFYLQLKGEVEETIRTYSLPSIAIYRPSMLLGKRKEFRFGELLTKILMKPFIFLIPQAYKPIQAKTVAQAMLKNAKLSTQGITVYEYNHIMGIA